MVLWSFSDGRIQLLVALCVLPILFERLETAFGRGELPDSRWRFIAGVAVTLAVGVAFMPGVALAMAVLVVVQLVFGSARGRGLVIAAAAVAAAAVLLFPFVPTMVSGGASGLGSTIGTTDLGSLARLALGGGPGTWSIAAFLPIAAVLAYSLVGPEHRGVASRAVVSVIAALALAWSSSAGYLPDWAANAPIYLALAAVGEALVVGLGLSSVLSGLGRESFGLRQIGTALLAAVLGAGIVLQSVAAMVGGWAVGGPDALPPAWAVVSSSAQGEFRVVWVGGDTETAFAPPGGDPVGVVPNGSSSIRYGLTGREGILATDTGRTLTGSGQAYLREALAEVVSGATTHGGALLAPLGVRFVVAQDGDLPDSVEDVLDAQVDLDREGASGLDDLSERGAGPARGRVPHRRALRGGHRLGGDGRHRAAAAAPSPGPVARRGRVGGRVGGARHGGGVDRVRPELGARGIRWRDHAAA